MAGKFEVYKDKAGKFRFRLKAGNGQIIATGEAYESKAALMNGIESIRSNAAAAQLVDMSDMATAGAKPSSMASQKSSGMGSGSPKPSGMGPGSSKPSGMGMAATKPSGMTAPAAKPSDLAAAPTPKR